MLNGIREEQGKIHKVNIEKSLILGKGLNGSNVGGAADVRYSSVTNMHLWRDPVGWSSTRKAQARTNE